MDNSDERQGDLPVADLPVANEAVARFVAYSSQYMFWITVAAIAVGIVLLQ